MFAEHIDELSNSNISTPNVQTIFYFDSYRKLTSILKPESEPDLIFVQFNNLSKLIKPKPDPNLSWFGL